MHHEHHRTPVTALAFFKHGFILSGEGSYLHAYNAAALELQKRIPIFASQAVHGIIIHEDEPISTAIVWGGALIRCLYLEAENENLNLTPGRLLNVRDWILDAAFAPSNQPLVAIVTAHNALWTARIPSPFYHSDSGGEDVSLEQRVAGSHCLLYSAHVLWLSSSRCLIASGTAFGDIIVWSATLHEDLSCTQSQTHYSFSAHQGSVFGVRLSSPLSISGLKCEIMLASCSDDRTIRLWDISDLTCKPPRIQGDAGFVSRATTAQHAPRCLSQTMGHISRIWHVRFLDEDADDGFVRLLSFGEDASVITWALGANNASYNLKQLRMIRAHSGKNIWSFALDSESQCLITGGADGAIARYSLSRSPLHAMEVPRTLLHEWDESDNFRAYAWVTTNVLASTTDHGRVFLIDFSSPGGVPAISEISQPLPGLRGYSFISSVAQMVFIGGADGIVYSFTLTNARLSELTSVGGKIAGLFACEDLSGRIALLVTIIGARNAELIVSMDSTSGDPHLEPNMTQSLTLPTGFITTSSAHYSRQSYNYAVLGSRHGSIAIYQYSNDIQPPLPCSKLYAAVHGKDAITALRWLPEENSACESDIWLCSVGRDGTFAVHAVHFRESQTELQLVHQLTLPFGPHIEGLDVAQNSKILAWGFKNKEFVVYDILAQREVMVVECGGAHRNWAFQPHHSGGYFVWTKASQVFQATQSSLPYGLLNPGGHGREIKAAAITTTLDSLPLLATGAEDTNIKLFTIAKTAGFTCLQTLRKHNTGIQQLKWHDSYLFSSGGFEEFFVWRIRSRIPYFTVGVVCESMHPRSGKSDLRVMGYNVASRRGGHAGFVIAMAYSDSTLKLWLYANCAWELLGAADYLTSCITHVFRVGRDGGGEEKEEEEDHLFTAATDGHIARWRLDHRDHQLGLRWLERYKVHQNGIHEVVHIDDIGDGTSVVVTGGDDNAIGITRLEGSSNSARTLLIPRAHAAAVTGIAVLRLSERIYWIASAGLDQRVKLWRLEIAAGRSSGVDGMAIRLLQDVFTAVADASSLTLCSGFEEQQPGTCVVVCGVGMDFWRLPNCSGTE